jgi:hypothetical protein
VTEAEIGKAVASALAPVTQTLQQQQAQITLLTQSLEEQRRAAAHASAASTSAGSGSAAQFPVLPYAPAVFLQSPARPMPAMPAQQTASTQSNPLPMLLSQAHRGIAAAQAQLFAQTQMTALQLAQDSIMLAAGTVSPSHSLLPFATGLGTPQPQPLLLTASQQQAPLLPQLAQAETETQTAAGSSRARKKRRKTH